MQFPGLDVVEIDMDIETTAWARLVQAISDQLGVGEQIANTEIDETVSTNAGEASASLSSLNAGGNCAVSVTSTLFRSLIERNFLPFWWRLCNWAMSAALRGQSRDRGNHR